MVTKQKDLLEYRYLGSYLDGIRRGKKIPYRIFEENNLSVKTFQRAAKGETDLKLSDLALITEILCLSPLEINLKAEDASLTVAYRKRFVSYLEQGEFLMASQVYGKFKEYVASTSRTLGKLSVAYMMGALSYIHDSNCKIDIQEVLDYENQILAQLRRAEVFTLFDLEFLALQSQLNLQKIEFNLIFRCLREVDILVMDLRTKQVFEQFLIHITLGTVKKDKIREFLAIEQIIQNLETGHWDWFFSMMKKIFKSLKHSILHGNFTKILEEIETYEKNLETLLLKEDYRVCILFLGQVKKSIENF